MSALSIGLLYIDSFLLPRLSTQEQFTIPYKEIVTSLTQCSATPYVQYTAYTYIVDICRAYIYINTYGQGLGILFRSVKSSVLLPIWFFFSKKKRNKTSALLRDLQIVAASKPIPWPIGVKTALISLNKNFGTLLTLVLGCFPLDIQP